VNAGGFLGDGGGTIEYCYALGDISVSAYGNICAGGFAGTNYNGGAYYCYTAGKVNVYIKGNNATYVHVGGFMGFGSYMRDCYALGDVFVDSASSLSTATINAGALVGDSTSPYGHNVSRCFAKGSVTVQSNGGDTVNAGGLAGIFDTDQTSGTLENCAALGASVTVSGGGEKKIGRVYGDIKGWRPSASNNYAYNGMKLYQSNTYGDSRPNELTAIPVVTGTPVVQGPLFDWTPPEMSGDPVLQEGINHPSMTGTPYLSGAPPFDNVSIYSINFTDPGGSGIYSVSMKVAESNPPGAGGNPSYWGDNRINFIDLSGLTDPSHYLRLNFTISDYVGSEAVYRIELKPNKANPVESTDFTLSVPRLIWANIAPASIGIGGITQSDIDRGASIGIGGIIPSDSRSGVVSTSMKVTSDPVTAGDNLKWNWSYRGGTITGIDLSELTDVDHYPRFAFTIKDYARNS
jgi:hypothetical protein